MTKVGRPREYRNDAAKQKAYRERKKRQKAMNQRLEALRNYQKGRNINVVYPGDACCLCGYTAIRTDDSREWSLKYKKYRHIPTVYWQGTKLTNEDWIICPSCVSDGCDCIIPSEPLPKIEWGDFETYLQRMGVSDD